MKEDANRSSDTAELRRREEPLSERGQIKARLQDREARLQSIFRAAPVGIGVVADRVIREANPTLCEMLGYAHEELIEQNSRMIYPGQEDYEFVGAEKYRQIRERGIGTVETRWRRKDGVVLDVLLSSVPLDPADLAKGVTFSALDITERKCAERALQESERRFRALVELLPYGVQENDIEGRITFANPALERLHGLRESGLVGRFIWDFLADDAAREPLRAYLQHLVREQPPPTTYFEKDRRADGSIIDVRVDWTYKRDESGQVQGFISVITDITEQRRAESRLNDYAGRLRQLSQRVISIQEEERRALARELHDDFGQQLAALKLNLGMLSRNLNDAASRRQVADCLEIADHVLERFRDTARDLRPDVLDDLGLSAALHWYARRQADRADCEIVVRDRLPTLPSEIEIAVFRIVQEAVDNAIRHGKARRIAIAVEATDQRLALIVQDDGGGFDSEAVFASHEADVGLGLLGMRERAELLGGRFSLVGRPGEGTVIEVTIPLVEALS